MRLVIAAVLLLIGIVWTGQGAGLIQGSFMTGSAFWLVIGIVCLLAGAGVLFVALSERGKAAR
jgi:hypothetical protein